MSRPKGELEFNGRNWHELSPADLRRRVGYLFQSPYLFPGTVFENLKLADDSLTEEQSLEFLSSTGLPSNKLKADVNSLSGGETQRVALARLLACQPQVLMLDEPTSSLDPTATQEIEQLITQVVSQRCLSAIWVTHDPDQALRLGHETLLLVAGRLVEAGESTQVINDPQTELGLLYKQRKLR